MSTLRKITESEKNFLKEKVIPYYMIYSKKDGTAFCQKCNTEFDVELLGKTKPGKETKCPKCNANVKMRVKGARKYDYVSEMGTGIIPCIDTEGNFVLRYFDVYRNYNPANESVMGSGYRECMRETYYSDGSFVTEDRPYSKDEFKVCKLRNNDYYMSNYTHRIIGMHVNISSRFVALYSRNLNMYLKEKLPRINFSFLKDFRPEYWYDLHYGILSMYESEEWRLFYEYLTKCGLNGIARTSLNAYSYIDLKAKSLIDILKIKKEQYRQLDEKSEVKDVLRFQTMNKYGIAEEDWGIYHKFLGKEYSSHVERFFNLFPYSLKKWAKYEEQQKKIHGHYIDFAYYLDYLRMCEELKLDIKNSFVATPRDLYASHDMVADMVNELHQIQREREFDDKLQQYADKANDFTTDYRKTVEKNVELFSYEDDELQIIVPEDTKAIGIEGFKLRHCVAQYVEDICKGEKTVLFLRKKNDIDTPFFTVEIIENEVTQCKGYRNCPRPENVERFIHKFAKAKHLTVTRNEHFAAVM